MTDLAHSTPHEDGSASIRRFVAALIHRAFEWLEARRLRRAEEEKLRAYLELERWQLDDLGLTRADVFGAIDSASERSASKALEEARRKNIQRAVRGIRRHHL